MMKSILIIALSLAVWSAAASDLEILASPVTGRVVDPSGNGVPGAVVAAKWVGVYSAGPSESGTACIKATAVRADDRGYFSLAAWDTRYNFGALDNIVAVIEGYKLGFIREGSATVKGTKSGMFIRPAIALPSAKVTVRVKPLMGQPEERREALSMQVRAATCTENDAVDLRLLYEAVREEAVRLPPEQVAMRGQRTFVEFLDSTLKAAEATRGNQ